jgi:hypothetical protein
MAKNKNARKKKYVNAAEQQKQQDVQYRKFFMDKLRNLCRQIGDESLFNLIPAEEKIVIYRFRGAPLKVVAATGAKIKKRLIEALEKIIKMQQTVMKLEVTKGSGPIMTFADYLLVGMSLEYHARDSEIKYADKHLFTRYAELRGEREEAYEKGLLNICAQACWVFDDIENKYLHTYDLETTGAEIYPDLPMLQNGSISKHRTMEIVMNRDFRLHQKITIGTYPLETRKVSVGGETHSAIQVGFLLYVEDKPRLHHCTLSPDDMHINIPSSTPKFPVYVQRHALARMRERIGAVPPAFHAMILVEALMRKEVIPVTRKRILIACFTNELKIGYFMAEVVDGVILIRTFLLLTNGGTPEGNRLSQLTGLQAKDRKYLAIDTLQGLANSDIEQNETICNLFRDAGCGSILELCKTINNDPGMMWLLDKSQPKNIISDLITEYMKPNTDDEEYVVS